MKIIVIGASGTIGRAVREELSQRHEVIRVGRTRGDYQVDITSQESVEALFAQTGEVDAIVSTTGNLHFGPLSTMTDSQFNLGLQDKLLGQIRLALIGEKLVKMTVDAVGNSGEIAVLSATAQATNQNAWIEEMKKVLAKPEYKDLKLVTVAYGDDQTDKSYREAQGLFKSYPNLKAIIAPTTVGIAAASKAVVDGNLVGKVFVTGLGLPSEMAGHVKSGAVKSFAIWNPIDLGYSITYAAHQFVTGKAGKTVSLGRVGTATPDADGSAPMAEPFTYDASNVEKFAKFF